LPPEALRQIAAAQEGREVVDDKILRSLIRQWRSNDPDRTSSPEWERLAPSTKKVWGSALNLIEEKWGEAPLVLFNDPRMRAKVMQWRDSRSNNPRSADIGVTVLRALLKFGMLHGRVLTNVASGVPSLYAGGDRAEIVWTDEEVQRFCQHANTRGLQSVADALRLAVTTGLRRDDLVSLQWGDINDLTVSKKARKKSRGRRYVAKIIRISELDVVLADLRTRKRLPGIENVLVDQGGGPWSPDRLTKAVGAIRDELNIVHVDEETGERRKKHLHDARGTYATKLMTTTNLTDQQVAEAMGWSPNEVGRIRSVYVDRNATVVALASRSKRSL
jgi:integrase